MPIKDLSKSLIDSVLDVCSRSVETHKKLTDKIVVEGLKHFGITDLSELSEFERRAFHAWTQLRLNEASCGCGEDVTEDDMPGDAPFHKDGVEDAEKKKDLGEEDDSEDELTESIALDADEIATNGAVGVTDAEKQLPIHADVIKDSDVLEGKAEYRLFVQFNTNTMPQIVPPVTLPGAPTIDALRDIVDGLPWFCDVCEKALADAADVPHERPEHAGVVAEAYVPTQYDKKVIAAIKQVTKAQKVQVEDYTDSGVHIREYSAVLEKSGSEDVLYFGCMESPSRKSPGKMTWTIRYELNDENADPNVGGEIKSVVGEPFPTGAELKSLSTLKSALAKLPID